MFIAILMSLLDAKAADAGCAVPVHVNYSTIPSHHRDEFIRSLDYVIDEWNGISLNVIIGKPQAREAEPVYGAINVAWGTVAQIVPDAEKLASTFVSTGLGDRVSRARIVMDKNRTWCDSEQDAGCFDMKNVLLHEMGHALGLNHSSDDAAVMFQNVYQYDRKEHLTQADIDMLHSAAPHREASCDTASGYLTWSRLIL
jgi:predicted Zn-dependent protease